MKTARKDFDFIFCVYASKGHIPPLTVSRQGR